MAQRRKNPDEKLDAVVQVQMTKQEKEALGEMADAARTPLAEMGRVYYRSLLDSYRRTGNVLLPERLRTLGYIGLGGDFPIQPIDNSWTTPPAHIRIPSEDCYDLIGIGISMTSETGPISIESGSHCLFCPCSTPNWGDLVHAEYDDKNGQRMATLKKWGGLDDNTNEYLLIPLNPKVKPIRCKPGSVEIRGRYVTHWRGES